MTLLRLAPPPPPEPVPTQEHDDFDHDFFRTESLAPVEVDAQDSEGKPRSPVRTALGALGALGASLAVAFLCIYMLVPTTDDVTAAQRPLPGGPLPTISAASSTAPAAQTNKATAVMHAPIAAPVPALVPTPSAEPSTLPAPAIAAAPVAVAPVATAAMPKSVPVASRAPARVQRTAVAAPRAPEPAADSGSDALVKAAFRALGRGDAQTAIAKARRVVEASPERADAWLVLGSAYGKLQDSQSAKLAFRACALRAKGPEAATCAALAR